jgi:hypothetical protein
MERWLPRGQSWFKWKVVQNKQVKMEGVHGINIIIIIIIVIIYR